MDDRIRVSDADRDRVTVRLREHFAAGRLTQDELDERVSAALNAKTFGDLRPVMADLPEPAPVPPRAAQHPQWAGPPWIARHRGPRVLPLMMLALLGALLISSGGWVLFAFFKVLLVFWLVACLAGLFTAGRFHRRMRRGQQSGYPDHWRS
ncbi:MAG TPA: DUF1707 domain-containing protein [Streptosporangiaceae bacterium]|nr:DUF1707 domain-containing protein [Streptosporangiaceae bacterium]